MAEGLVLENVEQRNREHVKSTSGARVPMFRAFTIPLDYERKNNFNIHVFNLLECFQKPVLKSKDYGLKGYELWDYAQKTSREKHNLTQ